MESVVKKASGKARIRSNSELLREFATPQGVLFHGRVRPHELISASLALNLVALSIPISFVTLYFLQRLLGALA